MAEEPRHSGAIAVVALATMWGTLFLLRAVPAFPARWRSTAAVAVAFAASYALAVVLRRSDAGDPHAPPAPPPRPPKPSYGVPVLLMALTGAAATGYSMNVLAVPRLGPALGNAAAGAAALAVFGGFVALIFAIGREPR